jgi:glutamate racemase
VTNRAPKILVFDSGLGGLTVHAELAKARPDADYVYAADDAAFPIGEWGEAALRERVATVMAALIAARAPDIVVIACNTASTLALPRLRADFPEIPFVGTVPAVKPAAEVSRSRLISVLATPGTVARDYTRDLIREYAAHCEVTLIGSKNLASIAEARMRGDNVDDIEIAREIAPCFVEVDGRQTDHVVLACTHYPLLMEAFRRLAPWHVEWVDPAPAIARRADHLLTEAGFARHRHASAGRTDKGEAIFTSGARPNHAMSRVLAERGLAVTGEFAIPLGANEEKRDAAQ